MLAKIAAAESDPSTLTFTPKRAAIATCTTANISGRVALRDTRANKRATESAATALKATPIATGYLSRVFRIPDNLRMPWTLSDAAIKSRAGQRLRTTRRHFTKQQFRNSVASDSALR